MVSIWHSLPVLSAQTQAVDIRNLIAKHCRHERIDDHCAYADDHHPCRAGGSDGAL